MSFFNPITQRAGFESFSVVATTEEAIPSPLEFEPSHKTPTRLLPSSPSSSGPRLPISFPDADENPYEGTGFGDRTSLEPGAFQPIFTLVSVVGFLTCAALYLRSGGENSFAKQGAYTTGALLLSSVGYNALLT